MSEQPAATTLVCSEYQRLLEESQRARENWNERRIEICRSRLVGKETGDELLRLQAKYAPPERTLSCATTRTPASGADPCRELLNLNVKENVHE